MRNNQPVNSEEFLMLDDELLASKTDLKGIITYCNDAFVEASGFSREELIGEPHNLVRHPDMPPEAFADLWKTLKNDKPWTGIVKNRRKNGGFYWVQANVTPLYEGEKTVGYMSVRSKPTREQIAAAENLYRDMRATSHKYQLHEGMLKSPGVLNKLYYWVDQLSIKARLILLLAMLLVMVAVLISYSLYNQSKMTSVSMEKIKLAAELSDAEDLARQAQVSFKKQVQEWKDILLRGHDAEQFEEYRKRFEEDGAEVVADLNKLKPMMIKFGFEMREVDELLKVHADLMSNYHKALESFVVSRSETSAVVDKLVKGADRNPTEQFSKLVIKMKQVDDEQIQQILVELQRNLQSQQTVSWGVMLAMLLLTIGFASLVLRSILRPLCFAMVTINEIMRGDYHISIKTQPNTEIGNMLNAMKSMQTFMGINIVEARKEADANLRIKIGLDNVSTSVMISDPERKIIYMNKSAHKLMQIAEDDLRKFLPDFNAASLMGANIDQFHKNPSHQKDMLASLNSTYLTQIEVGGRTFALAANPVINERGMRLGTALEWHDRTAEVAVENEVEAIVGAAVLGDFTKRIEMQGKEGFFKLLAMGINQLMVTSDHGLQEVVRMLESLARGDLTDRIANDYTGTFGQLKDDANVTAEKLSEIIGQIKDATDTINTAAREIAAGNNDLSQRTEQNAISLEKTASSMEELTSTVKQNTENAKQANQLAIGASDIASKGGVVVGQVVTTMDSINESSRKIVDIISVIDGIAFQTNILALNAAVEAARAGEQGKGFAVVAGEVRNLAQRSAAAAREIKSLIGDSVEKIEGGSKLVSQAGQTMEEIVTAIKRVTSIMSEITTASVEQSAGIEQVNLAITQMDEVTQQNAALVEEAAAAAASLEEQAHNLSMSLGTFKMDKC